MNAVWAGLVAADPPGGGSATTGQLVIQWLVALGVGGVLTALATGFLSRKKTASEASKNSAEAEGAQATAASVLTGSAVSLLQRMDGDLVRLSKRVETLEQANADLQQKVEDGQQRERGHVRQLVAYRAWAEEASLKLSEAGIPIEPPPHEGPSFPPLPPSPRRPPR